MKLATITNGTADGALVIVSRDLETMVPAAPIASTMQDALDRWESVEPELKQRAALLESGEAADIQPFVQANALAPLPRAWQWLDASVYATHDRLMSSLFKLKPTDFSFPPMYQGLSDHFYSATDDVPMPTESDDIDFEGEFGVVTSRLPAGATSEQAAEAIRLVVLINDWSLRRFAPIEKPVGFGWIRAKPSCSLAPVAVTPDELGDAWVDTRTHLPLNVWYNEDRFGAANGGPMLFSFADLIAHAAYNRDIVAGTIVGSGTVSNENYAEVGSSCIAERRAIEALETGNPITPYMKFGDRVKMSVQLPDGSDVFGTIHQKVVRRPTA